MLVTTLLRKGFRAVGILALFLASSGCNPEVFVDRLTLSSEQFSLNGEGETSVVDLSSDEWMVSRIELDIVGYEQLPCNVYDEAGELINESLSLGYAYLPGLGKITFEDKYVDFTIKRTQGKQLEISVGENLRNSDFRFTVELHNLYDFVPITITQSPGSGYIADSIVYTLKAHTYSTYLEKKETIHIMNTSSGILPYKVNVFSSVTHKVCFTSADRKLFSYLKANNKGVRYPRKVTDSGFEMSDQKVSIYPGMQEKPLSFGEVTKTVNLRAGKNQISVYWEYEEYGADFVLYMSNKQSGSQKCVRGIFHSKMPTGDFYVLVE